MLAILNITAPIFMVMGLGFCAVRLAWFKLEELQGAAKFVMRVGLPALVFYAVTAKPLHEVFDPIYMLGYGGATLTAFMVGWLLGRVGRRQDGVAAALSGFAMSFSNTGFIGYPLLVMVIGVSEAGRYLAMNAILENVLVLPLFFVLVDAAKQRGQGIWVTIKGILWNLGKNPIILTMAVALVFAVGEIPVPAVLVKVTTMLSQAAAPVALFVIGGGLAGLSVRGSVSDMVLLALGKLVLFPILVTVGLWLAGADRQMMFVGALLASVPMASMFPLLAAQYGYAHRGAATMLLTTNLSFKSISLVLFLGHTV